MVKISVGLPVYNGSQWLDECIRSILNQSYKDFELVIVDDGSIDDSKKIVEHYLKDNRVRYIYQENKGFTGATNRCIRESKGNYIAFISQDDIWLSNKLELQIQKIEDEGFDLVHSDVYHIDSNGEVICRRNPKIPRTKDRKEVLKSLFLNNYICHQSVLVKRECFDKLGLFDEQLELFSDYDMWLRIAGEFDIGYLDTPLVKKRIHEGQASVIKSSRGFEDLLLIIEKACTRYPYLQRFVHKRKAHLYHKLSVDFLRKDRVKEARKNIIRAIKLNPFNVKYYIILILPYVYKNFLGKNS